LEEGKRWSRREILAAVAGFVGGVAAGIVGTRVTDKLAEQPPGTGPVTLWSSTSIGQIHVIMAPGLLRVQLPTGYAGMGVRGFLPLFEGVLKDRQTLWRRHRLNEWQRPDGSTVEEGIPASGVVEFRAPPGKETYTE